MFRLVEYVDIEIARRGYAAERHKRENGIRKGNPTHTP